MDGREHAAKAERLLIDSQQIPDPTTAVAALTAAQVHATLALAASVEFISIAFQMSPTGSLPVEVVGR